MILRPALSSTAQTTSASIAGRLIFTMLPTTILVLIAMPTPLSLMSTILQLHVRWLLSANSASAEHLTLCLLLFSAYNTFSRLSDKCPIIPIWDNDNKFRIISLLVSTLVSTNINRTAKKLTTPRLKGMNSLETVTDLAISPQTTSEAGCCPPAPPYKGLQAKLMRLLLVRTAPSWSLIVLTPVLLITAHGQGKTSPTSHLGIEPNGLPQAVVYLLHSLAGAKGSRYSTNSQNETATVPILACKARIYDAFPAMHVDDPHVLPIGPI